MGVSIRRSPHMYFKLLILASELLVSCMYYLCIGDSLYKLHFRESSVNTQILSQAGLC